MGDKSPVTVIDIHLSGKDGWFYAMSPEIPELHVCGTDKNAVMNDIGPLLKKLYKLNYGLDISLVPAAGSDLKPVKKFSFVRDHLLRLLAFPVPEMLVQAGEAEYI